ncbi:MAG: zinc ribbon domain-containing protein [Chloroflexi bacterium]|nr:zinc ribbon domain-containing protein [Chloroflexota bacterium]
MTKIGRQKPLSKAKHLVPVSLALTAAMALVLVFLTPVSGAEDGQTRIKSFKISVEPEYDEPRVLVVYQGEFDDKASFPKIVKFRLPKDAEVGQVCALSEKKEHLCQLYETKKGEDFIELSYTLPIPTFYIEFYYNPIQSEGAREIGFSYAHVYPADKVDVEVQQPLRSTDFSVYPNPLSTSSDNQGFKYSNLSFENVRADQKLDLKISYTKQDKNPSVPKAKQGSGAPAGGSGLDVNVWLILGSSVALAGVVYVGLSRRSRQFAPHPARVASRAAPATQYNRQPGPEPRSGSRKGRKLDQLMQVAQARQGAGFCSGCGNPLEVGDRFCSACGKKSK